MEVFEGPNKPSMVKFLLEHEHAYLHTIFNAYMFQCHQEHERKKFISFLSRDTSSLPPGLVTTIIERCDWDSASRNAALLNRQDIISQLVQEKKMVWDEGLNGACLAQNRELMNYMFAHGAKITGETLELTCRRNDMSMVEYLISHLNRYIKRIK